MPFRHARARLGFVPQSLIDSVQLADSTMVWNARKGQYGKVFIQFSFRSGRLASSIQLRSVTGIASPQPV